MYCSHDSTNGILPTLAIVINPPDVRTVTDTPFVLQQLGFVAVESANDNKRTYLKKKKTQFISHLATHFINSAGYLPLERGKFCFVFK